MSIDLLQYICEKDVILNVKPKSKRVIVSSMLDHLIEIKKIKEDNKKRILKTVIQREEMGSTAIGGFICLPHARLDCIKDIVLCIGISKEGVVFESLDQEPVNIIMLLLSNQNEAGLHLKALAHLAKLLRDKFFVQQLKDVDNESRAIALIKKQDSIIR